MEKNSACAFRDHTIFDRARGGLLSAAARVCYFTQPQDISHNLCALAATPSQPRNAARAVRDQIASGLDYLELSI
jgi:hypothetical protein